MHRIARKLLALLFAAGCGGPEGVPGSQLDLAQAARNVAPILRSGTGSSQGERTIALTYGGDADWMAAKPYLMEILGDPNEDPKVVTKMQILIEQAARVLGDAAGAVYDSVGATTAACTVIPPDHAISTPWFDEHGETPFFALTDAGAYQCLTTSAGQTVLIGRTAVPAPPANCVDPHRYQFMTGGATNMMPNSEDVAHRGSWVSISFVFKGSYDRCSGELALAFAHLTLYESGMRFGSRSELFGSALTHSFRVRSLKLDTPLTPEGAFVEQYGVVRGAGVSQTASADHFIISYQRIESTPGAEQSFCMSVSPALYAYAPSASGCDAYESAFGDIVPLIPAQVPQATFAIDFGVGDLAH